MKFQCTDCSQLMEVETIYAGRKVECPSCGKTVEIPAAADDVEVVPPVSEDPGMSVNQPSPGDENLRTIVETLWGKTIRAGDKPEMTLKPGTRDDITIPGKGETMRGPRSDGGKMPDAVKVRPKDISAKGSSATVPEYEILRMLGEGGMGMVYEARQTAIDRSIAIKMIKPEAAKDEEECRLFLAEAVATADLDHPNIVPIHDLGMNSEGALFYAMKQVKGTSWKDILPEKSLDENLDILMRVADAVAFAHNRGVIHRDLKPENVMLGDFGEVLLMDWGLAAAVTDEAKADKLDPDHAIGGTPSYMAPEMAVGDASKIGYASDVYLLGAILFEIVTGMRPHSGTDVMDCLANAAENKIEETDDENELIDIALKAMATEPTDRYESVKAFQSAVREYQQHEESIVLVSKAHRALEEARKTKDYERFVDAVSGCKQALELWSGNERAKEGLIKARLAYAECAFEKRDYDLALSMLDKKEASHGELRSKVEAARKERDARNKRLKIMKVTSAVSAAAVVLILSVAAIWINRARQQAEHQRNQAEIQRGRAEDALNSLRGTAPTFYKMAQEMVAEMKFAEAMTNINYAISLVPENSLYQKQKGNILQSMLDMKGAAAAYELAIQNDPDTPHAAVNLQLCRKVISDNAGREELSASSLGELYAAMQKQERNQEALALSRLLQNQTEIIVPMLRKMFDDRGLGASSVSALADGRILVDLRSKGLDDLSFLQGMPIDLLTLGSEVKDFSMLKGMPLTELDALAVKSVKDLSPLKGMKLTKLHIGRTNWSIGVEDLSPLHGMPLKSLLLARASVSDLSPLEGMPLEELDLSGCFEIRDLSPLKEMPLRKFSMTSYYNAETGSSVRDISSLRGAPLEDVDLTGMPLVRDISPLADAPLKSLNILPEEVATGFDEIRNIKTLVKINNDPPAVFWKKYDAGEFYEAAEFKDRIQDAWPGAVLKNAGNRTVSLDIRGRKDVVDLKPLKGVPLSSLTAYGCRNLHDLSGLEDTPLKTLIIWGTAVSNLSPLAGMKLESLKLGEIEWGTKTSRIKDLSPLKGIPLTNLDIQNSDVSDISPLKGMPLSNLDLSRTLVADLSPLKGMPLETLKLTSLGLKGLSSLKDLPLLKSLDISGAEVKDLSPLKGMSLESLVVSGYEIKDISPLAGMPLKELSIAGTSVTDVTPLAGMKLESLQLINTPGSDLSPLKGMALTSMSLNPERVTGGIEVIRNMKSLKNVNSLPADKFWKKYDAGEFKKK